MTTMSNSFDFELVADDQVSEVIDRINDALRDIEPKLNKTKEGLKLGGQETLDGLNGYNSRLELMARSARDNVQLIGDMVPPLKMVGEIAGKLGALGVAGAVGYGLKQVAYGFREASREAYNLDVSAKNAGMRVEEFSRLAGAMQINGSDSESARTSIEGFAKALKEANSGSNQGMMAAFSTIGVQIQKNKDGSVDTLKTLQEIARVFPTLRPEQQKSVADAMGFTPEMLALMREGTRLTELLAKSDKFGLTIDPQFNEQMKEANRQMNELWSRFDGLKKQGEKKLLGHMLPDEKQSSALKDAKTYDGSQFYHGDREKDIRWKALRDKEFTSSLSFSERMNFTLNRPDPEVEKKLNARYGAAWQAYQLQGDMAAINGPQAGTARGNVPYGQARNDARGFRNHNPGNLREASNTTGKSGGFSTFATDDDGLSAMARQLMLYGDRGNNTLNGIIHTYAPRKENDTRAYVDSVSGNTGFGTQERINLHDPETLKSIMAAMIKHENGAQPYTEGQLENAIQAAISDDRWSSKRNPDALAQQRYDIISGSRGGERGTNILTGPLGKSDDSTLSDNLARSLKEAMSDQTLKLEITMVNDKGERKTYNVGNNGRITTPMNY